MQRAESIQTLQQPLPKAKLPPSASNVVCRCASRRGFEPWSLALRVKNSEASAFRLINRLNKRRNNIEQEAETNCCHSNRPEVASDVISWRMVEDGLDVRALFGYYTVFELFDWVISLRRNSKQRRRIYARHCVSQILYLGEQNMINF